MKMELLFTIIAYFPYFKELNGVGKVVNKQKKSGYSEIESKYDFYF